MNQKNLVTKIGFVLIFILSMNTESFAQSTLGNVTIGSLGGALAPGEHCCVQWCPSENGGFVISSMISLNQECWTGWDVNACFYDEDPDPCKDPVPPSLLQMGSISGMTNDAIERFVRGHAQPSPVPSPNPSPTPMQ